ncbi:MAG: hypothetical protein M3R14_11965, partial [Acidobacteriota bacterium]|nr:hypothetical protein [Acidobacteriota bacterium]
RVDLRLRPHGRVGALAISFDEAVNYYKKSAQSWERQVLIRSRVSAGDAEIFQKFFEQVESSVFSTDETVENALSNVRLSKEKINLEKTSVKNFNVKLGTGGIREIEFIAQALQLAFAGKDEWLRAAHTLISLSRLADRQLLSEAELTELFEAYEFLRRLEHRLQMENGLQTQLLPNDADQRSLIAQRMNYADLGEFENALEFHTKNVNLIFSRVFQEGKFEQSQAHRNTENTPAVFYQNLPSAQSGLNTIFSSLEKSDAEIDVSDMTLETLKLLSETSPHFSELIAANPNLIRNLPTANDDFNEQNYREIFLSAVGRESDYKNELAILRKIWSRFLLEIVVFDIFEKISRQKAKRLQTDLAEAGIETALFIARRELERRFSVEIDEFPFAVLGLGKLGGGGMDYGSDLDLILVYDEKTLQVKSFTNPEFYSRAVEIFVTTLSSLTRDGHLYRVDLRLRPDGKNGATSTSKIAFLDYLETRAAIWEWLAYVKLRGVAGDLTLAKETEFAARKIIHEKAQRSEVRGQRSEFKILREETLRIRERLEAEKAGGRKDKEIDIKFGAGGMLDVYFVVRFLQLRDNIPDDAETRTTDFTLRKLFENESLEKEAFENFSNGYAFLSELDHNLRLTVGRSSRLPLANQTALQTIVERMKLESIKDLLEQLTFHRLNIRSSFEAILKS